MKNTIIKAAGIAILLLTAGCAKWTEIEPKGTNMLQKVSDLDMLLNYRYNGGAFALERASVFMGDIMSVNVTMLTPAYDLITQPRVDPLESACFTWDETIDRALYTETDTHYTRFYGMIGQICNPIIMRADAAKGDRVLADRLKAEAYVLRAWYHYLLVNMYAKAYDPATAAEEGGIPYSRETDLLSVPNEKRTVQVVYDLILEDLDAAFALNSLSAPTQNRMRVNTAFAHAVKAKVLMSMRDYDGASQAAAASLAIENTVDDYNVKLTLNPAKFQELDYSKLPEIVYINSPGFSISRPEMGSNEDLFFTGNNFLMMLGVMPELAESVEPGNIFFSHAGTTDYGSVYFGLNVKTFFDMSIFLNPGGLSTVDMYLIQAECLIRKGDAASIAGAIEVMNNIRSKRMATEVYGQKTDGYSTPDLIASSDYYSPWTAANPAEAIALLKKIDRTENWYGPKRFINAKRWNTENDWKETLSKHVECVLSTGVESFDFTLSPGSPLWVYPFPSKSTGLNPNLTQNY